MSPDLDVVHIRFPNTAGNAQRLNDYHFPDRYPLGVNPTCGSCALTSGCGKGCPAAVIAASGRIGDVDAEQCPVTLDAVTIEGRRLLPLIRA